MLHKREVVIQRAIQEFELLDGQVVKLRDEDWKTPLLRPETKDPWTVKDALAHITYWRANMARSFRRERRPPEERGLDTNAINHLIYLRWRERSPQEVLTWHRQTQEEVLSALRAAPEEWFTGKERSEQWPFDLIGHSAYHRTHDIQRALDASSRS